MGQSVMESRIDSMRRRIGQLTKVEERVLHRFEERAHVSRNTNLQFDETLSFGQRVADSVAAFGGSWLFISIFASLLTSWILVNSVLSRPFDPYPFILLNLFLSTLAAVQAPIILMSQNRQSAKDRLDATHDYEVNLKAELEVMALHDKVDSLRETQWAELVVLQQEQLRLLEAIELQLASISSSGPVAPG